MSVHLNIIRGTGLNKTIVSYRVNRSGARGPSGAGLPTGGLIGQFIRKTSDAIDFATEWFTATAADVGADPAGSAAAVQGNLDDHEGDTDNPHLVLSSQVAEDVFDNGTKTVDTVIDWANGAVQSINIDGVIINISATGWDSLAPTGEGKAQAGTLIITGGDTAEPTFDDVNQGQLPTYTAGFANVQELASLGPDGSIYNMWQVSNDQHVLLGPELVTGTDSDMSGPNNWNGSNFTIFDINSTVPDKMYFVGDGVNDYAILAGVFTVGATFLIKLKGRLNSGASTELRIGANLGVSAEYLSFTPTGIENTFSGIVTISTGGTMFLGRTGAGFNGVAFEIDDVEIWRLF